MPRRHPPTHPPCTKMRSGWPFVRPLMVALNWGVEVRVSGAAERDTTSAGKMEICARKRSKGGHGHLQEQGGVW